MPDEERHLFLTIEEKADLVARLCLSIAADVIKKIKTGHVPEGWTEIFIREFLADKFHAERLEMENWMRRRYKQDVKERKL